MSSSQCPNPKRRNDRGARARTLVALSTAVSLLVSCTAAARLPLDEATEQLLVEAVEAAAAVDFYNARCRSDVSGRRTDNLNKELVSRLRTTVLSVQDDLFPERSYRRVQERLQEEFLETLRQAGGCKGAKESGMPERLGARYEAAINAIEALP